MEKRPISRPGSVQVATYFLYGSLVLSGIAVLGGTGETSSPAVLGTFIGAILLGGFTYAASQGRNGARIALSVLALVGMFSVSWQGHVSSLHVAGVMARLSAVIMLFQKQSSAWFRQMTAFRKNECLSHQNRTEENKRQVIDVPASTKRASPATDTPVESADLIVDENNDNEEIPMMNLSDRSDEEFYEIAAKEFDSGEISKGLMLKAEVAAGGDQGKARLFCIRTRAQEMAQEAGALGRIKEAYTDAVKDSKSADKLLMRMEDFKTDYPENAEIDELRAEFEYQQLEECINDVHVDYASDRHKRNIQIYDSFLAENPEHFKRNKIEERRSRCEEALDKIRDQNAFRDIHWTAQKLVDRHKYQEASALDQGYLGEYSECADEARDMIEDIIPKLIEDGPLRKLKVRCKIAISAVILVVCFFAIPAVYDVCLSEMAEDNYKSAMGKLVLANDHLGAEVLFRKAAEYGHAEAQYQLGLIYKEETVAVPNHLWAKKEATKWFSKAAEQGNGAAQKELEAILGSESSADEATVAQESADSFSGPADDFWPLVDQYSPGSREMNRNSDPAWVDYIDAVDKQTGLTNRERAEAAMKSNDPKAMAAIFDECRRLNSIKNEKVFWNLTGKAKRWWEAAEQGRADAQYYIGSMFARGDEGLVSDYKEASKWYRKAAHQGYADAQYSLACCYFIGKGVTSDSSEMLKWYRKAAEQGHAEAQWELGYLYTGQKEVAADVDKSKFWYRKAALRGHDDAQNSLGELYLKQGDRSDARRWFQKAAEQGNETAEKNLAAMSGKESASQKKD